jgi:hypothetical protein
MHKNVLQPQFELKQQRPPRWPLQKRNEFSIASLINQLVLFDPRHHRAQRLSNRFNLVL